MNISNLGTFDKNTFPIITTMKIHNGNHKKSLSTRMYKNQRIFNAQLVNGWVNVYFRKFKSKTLFT